MQKRKYNIRLALLLCLYLFAKSVFAQININIPQANILNRVDYEANFNTGSYNPGLGVGLFPTIRVAANSASFLTTTGLSIPFNLAPIKLVSIGSVSLLSYTNVVELSTSEQILFGGVVSVGTGNVMANTLIKISNNHTWRAGTYSTNINYRVTGILVSPISPASHEIRINIPSFIQTNGNGLPLVLLVDDLTYYRNASGINGNKVATVTTTVPYIPNLRADNSLFNFGITAPYNSLPNTSVNNIVVSLTGTAGGSSINLSTTAQALAVASGIQVPTNNSHNLNYNFAINGASLKSNFVQAGNYSVPITFTWNNAPTFPNTSALAINSALEVRVSDLGEIVANQSAVDLVFSTTNDYQNGVSKDMPAHLRLSKTTPYNLYVRASSSQFSAAGNQIPLDVLRIGPMVGESGLNTVTLSTTPQQIINSANPVIDRDLSIRYTIPASETFKLINKPNGIYSTNIIYSFIAL